MPIKKLVSIILAVIIACSTLITGFTFNELSKDILIKTSTIPNTINKYASSYFDGLKYDYLLDLGFTEQVIPELKLSKGFIPYEYDDCDAPLFYFPITDGKSVLAMIRIADLGTKGYSVQMGKSELSDSLSKLDPEIYSLIITDYGMFSISKNNKLSLLESYYFAENEGLNKEEIPFPNIRFNEITYNNPETINIAKQTLSNLRNANDVSNSPSRANKALSVPFVPNMATTDYPAGVCWAAAAASIIKYKKITFKTATTIRDEIINKGYTATYPNITNKMADEIDDYLLLSTPHITTTMSFSNVQAKIDGYKPIYTTWLSSDGPGHVLVIRSYELDSNGNQSVGFMDCNYSYYTAMTFGTSFVNGTKIYTWVDSIYLG